MSRERLTRAVGDFTRSFSSDISGDFRKEVQDLGPAMSRAKLIREAQDYRGTGQYDRRYIGSIPITVLNDWLKKHGFRMDEFARNEGGNPYSTDPHFGGGVKDKFLKYFLSRDFSKLHTQHTTTRRENGQIVVPDNYIGGSHGTNKLRGTED